MTSKNILALPIKNSLIVAFLLISGLFALWYFFNASFDNRSRAAQEAQTYKQWEFTQDNEGWDGANLTWKHENDALQATLLNSNAFLQNTTVNTEIPTGVKTIKIALSANATSAQQPIPVGLSYWIQGKSDWETKTIPLAIQANGRMKEYEIPFPPETFITPLALEKLKITFSGLQKDDAVKIDYIRLLARAVSSTSEPGTNGNPFYPRRNTPDPIITTPSPSSSSSPSTSLPPSTSGALPSPWQLNTSVLNHGSATYNNGEFVLTARTLIYQQLTGNFEMSARVQAKGTPPLYFGENPAIAKFYIFNTSDSRDSIRIYFSVQGNEEGKLSRISFSNIGASNDNHQETLPINTTSIYLKLQKIDSKITTLYSLDGNQWTSFGSTSLPRNSIMAGLELDCYPTSGCYGKFSDVVVRSL